MSVIKEYVDGKTKIRIHDDYVKDNDKSTKETIISLIINYFKEEEA